VREWGSGKSRLEQFREYTNRHPIIVPQLSLDDGIAAVRVILPACEFDAGPCAEGLKALRAYRREWNEEYATWRDKPRHDWASHGADAFRVLASRYRYVEPPAPKPWKPDVENPVLMVNPQALQVEYVGGFSIFEWTEKRRKKREAEI
jgi:hypothetical protein